ncbi:MAG: heme lyase CcmF/NrfE family subunit [Alphaproteobacteria bacterium]
MTGELGQFSLALALALSLVQTAAGFWGAWRNDAAFMAAARGAAFGMCAFVAAAFAALTYAYVVSDFSVLAVAQNSHTAKPLIYKISGVWGNHEGSMLLWLLVLGVYSAGMALMPAGAQLRSRALGVQGAIGVLFLLFVLFTSNPFWRLDPPPFEGAGLNPVLQDPGLAFHPPLLYLGYVGLSAVFAYAVAALLDARGGTAWITASRPFALVAWTALTLGVALGSWWAYYTLGWGGFWFWDPVENASLMPLLLATALIHAMMPTAKRGSFKSWSLLLAIAAFAFSLIGTFIVRSGVLTSVHAFANDPARGVFILGILALVVGIPLVLYAWWASLLSPGEPYAPVSRETGILVNGVLLVAATATICLGTLYPLALEAVTGDRISVGPPYFAITVVPVFALLALATPFGPILKWGRTNWRTALRPLSFAAVAALAAGLVAILLDGASLLGFAAVALGVWLIAGAIAYVTGRVRAIRDLRMSPGAWGMTLAHAGLGVVALGIAGATMWKTETVEVLAPGQSLNVAGYVLRLEKTEQVRGPNYFADRATFTAFAGGRPLATMRPERRSYPVEGQAISKTAIYTTGWSDLYVALGDEREKGSWVVRAYRNPLAPFIWFGAGIMALGGIVAFRGRLRAAKASKA